MAPTFALRDPLAGAVGLAAALRAGAPPPLPLADFVEVSSLEVNYLGMAVKPSRGARDGGVAGYEPRTFAPGELRAGLRQASRAGR